MLPFSFCGISFYVNLAFFLVFLTLPTRWQQEANINAKAFGSMLEVCLVIFIWYLLHREHIFLIFIYLLRCISLYIIYIVRKHISLYVCIKVYFFIAICNKYRNNKITESLILKKAFEIFKSNIWLISSLSTYDTGKIKIFLKLKLY